MKTLQTVIIVLVIAVIAFGSGYLLGTAKIFRFKNTISNLKNEIINKDMQLLLVQIKVDLKEAISNVSGKNFGLAADLISKNRKAISDKIAGFDEQAAAKIKTVDASLERIAKSIDAMKAASKEEINLLIKNIDNMLQEK